MSSIRIPAFDLHIVVSMHNVATVEWMLLSVLKVCLSTDIIGGECSLKV